MTKREHWVIPERPYASYREYLAAVGGDALAEARRRTPEEVLDEVVRSGLRGRGGAGFPTGVKWQAVARHACPTRWVVMNAAEGEPGTFKDRWRLRHDPYGAIEGLLVAAHAVGAKGATIAIKASFTPELERLRGALAEMASAIAPLEVVIVEGPEEYLFGEEKALLEVIEGNGPLPREAHAPPYEVGLFATPGASNPCVVNNVETFARVPGIVRAGAASFRELGTQDTPGTLLFTLSGAIRRPGVYEAPAGIPLGELFHEHGAGPRPGRRFVAALSGVSTGVLPAERFATPADFGSLALAGSGLGSAGFVLLDDSTSLARVAQAVTRFLYVESCNQCSACKAGLRTASRTLDALCATPAPGAGHLPPDVLERALFGARSAPQGNRCYLPVQASVLLSSLVARFREPFELLARGEAEAGDPWRLPKIVDYDPETPAFRYDERQERKRPDWTYEEPLAAAPGPVSAPAPRSGGDASVRISADLVEALGRLADAAHTDLDHEVDSALREWLARRTPQE